MRASALIAFTALAWSACSAPPEAGNAAAQKGAANEEQPLLQIAVVSDLEGVLEPCGCGPSSQGGIDRLIAAVDALRASPVPLVLLGVGDLFAERGGAPSETNALVRQREAKNEVLGALLAGLPWNAITPGPGDLVRRRGAIEALVRATAGKVVVVRPPPAATAAVGEELEGLPVQLAASVAGTRLGITGAALPQDANAATEVADLAVRVRRLRAEGAALVLALVATDAALDEALLSSLAADLVVVAGAGGEVYEGVVAATGSRQAIAGGRTRAAGLTVVELFTRPAAGRLPVGTLFARGRVIVLDQEAPADAGARRLLDQLFKRLAEQVPEPSASADTPEGATAASPFYVGSRACGSCHTEAYVWWRGTAHGRAFETLQAHHRQLDLECVGCHVTGYGEPGGATLPRIVDRRLADLRGVGCESCHGPGSRHADDPRAPRTVRRSVVASTCAGCHDPEHGEPFDYASRVMALRSAAHASSSGASSGGRAEPPAAAP